MSLALPAALWGLLILPVLVLLRVLARRPRVVVVPSLIPWRAAAGAAAPDRRRILLDWQLLLQLAAAAAAVLAAAGPEVLTRAAGAREVVVVLDNSASTAAGGRLAEARARLRQELEALGADLAGSLWVTSPLPRRLAGPAADRWELLSALGGAAAAEAGGDLAAAVGAARRGRGKGGVLLVASDDLSPIESLSADELVTIRVGKPVRNFGIVAAAVEDGQAFCAVRSASNERLEIPVDLDCGGVSVSRSAEIGPGERRGFSFPLPKGAQGLVRLSIPADDLAADNAVWLAASPGGAPVVLRSEGRSTRSVERALSAAGFPPARLVSPGAEPPPDARLVVASGQVPAKLPPEAFLILIKPLSEARFRAEARLGRGDPNFFPHAAGYRFEVPAAVELKPLAGTGAATLLADAGRALVLLTDRVCALAFDPEATEWVKHPSFPVFFARLVERAPRLAAMRRSFYRTGERAPATFGGRISAPGGRTVEPGAPLAEVGVYKTSGRPAFAANLLNEEETACRTAGREVRRLRPAGEPRIEKKTPLAPWLFALALACLAAEWLLAWRGKAGHG